MYERLARTFLSVVLLGSGISKIASYSYAFSSIRMHGIIPLKYLGLAICIHAFTSTILGVVICIRMGTTLRRITDFIALLFILISTTYLVIIIIVNGWEGDCACFPGIYSSNTLHVPLLFDIILVIFMLVLVFKPMSKEQKG